MDPCYYSIIPTQENPLVCSSCGEEIMELPYYQQVQQRFICIKIDGNTRHYIGLGLGIPLCKNCYINTYRKVAEKERKYGYIFLFVIIAFLIISFIDGGDLKIVIIPLILALVFFMSMFDKFKQESIEEVFDNMETERVKQASEYFRLNGWKKIMSSAKLSENYTPESLKADLDAICGEGEFCLLDNTTGIIVDYQDPEVVDCIFDNSKWTYEND